MGINEKSFADLYSDERQKPILSPMAEKKFSDYLSKLAVLSLQIRLNDSEPTSKTSHWQVWENGLRQIYKEMIYDAFEAFDVDMPKDMEVHFAGSLAKAQATEFSDLDAFVIVKNEADVAKVKPVFDALNNLCQRIFTTNSQLYPDPIGINPSRLIGTPQQLFDQLNSGEAVDVGVTVTSILTSKPILPRFGLGEELRELIKNEPRFEEFLSAKQFYEVGVNQYPAPKNKAAEVNIKSHIMRPIDFMLMGLREEFNLYSEDGSHLSAPGALKLLRIQNLLPEEEIERIERVYNQAMKIRFDLHAEHRAEHDEIAYTKVTKLLDEVEKIRDLGRKRMARMDNLKQAVTLWDAANAQLEKGRVKPYLIAAQKLNIFMKEAKLTVTDLRPLLADRKITPKSFSILAGIFDVGSNYSRASAGMIESTVEVSLVSAANKISEFFMDCQLKPRVRSNPDPKVKVNKASILIAIMQFIKEMVTPISKIWVHETKALMAHKIAAVRKLQKDGKTDMDSLEQVMSSKGENLAEYLSYAHATRNAGRNHKYMATTDHIDALKGKYEGLRGDALKTEILLQFRIALAQATDRESLEHIVKSLKLSNEYKVLASGQGFTTRFFGLNTSSIIAFQTMVKEARADFKSQEKSLKLR
jgi:effector protein DrrA/SidM